MNEILAYVILFAPGGVILGTGLYLNNRLNKVIKNKTWLTRTDFNVFIVMFFACIIEFGIIIPFTWEHLK